MSSVDFNIDQYKWFLLSNEENHRKQCPKKNVSWRKQKRIELKYLQGKPDKQSINTLINTNVTEDILPDSHSGFTQPQEGIL
jgi:hypothetical protein